MQGWAEWLPLGGWRLRSVARIGLAGLVRQMKRAAKCRGWITIFSDEVAR